MKNTWIVAALLLTIFLCGMSAIPTVMAQSGEELNPANQTLNIGEILTAENQNQSPNIGAYVIRLVNFLSLTIGSFAFLALVIGGIMMITAMGKEDKITKGKDIIKAALFGLLIAFGAYWSTAFVQSIFYDT